MVNIPSLRNVKIPQPYLEEVEATLVEGRITLDKADNNDNADNARLNITSSRAHA